MPSADTILFHLVEGVIFGCIVALVALGLSMIFGIMGIINMAHGDMYMVGAVIAVIVTNHVGSFWLALLAAPLVLGLTTLPLERWVLRPFEGEALPTMVGTVGVSWIIQQLVLITWGGSFSVVPVPVNFTVSLGGVAIPGYRIVAALIGLGFAFLLWIIIHRTRFGLSLRATIDQPGIAEALGINTSRVRAVSFGIGAALAAVGGVLAAPIENVYYLMGSDVLLLAFIVVIVGGLGSLGGTFVAAIVVAAVQGLLGAFVSPIMAEIWVFALLALAIVVRPNGVFRSGTAQAVPR